MSTVSTAGRLSGKIAFITGVGGGQGRAAAILFAREGARVVGCDVKKEGAEETVEMVRAVGGEMVASAPLNLADEAEVKRWIAFGVSQFGGMDILYNNASAQKFAPIAHMTLSDWNFTLTNEITLIFLAIKHAIPEFSKRGGGSIINTISAVALDGAPAVPGSIAHTAAKGAVQAMTNHLAGELANLKVRVNSVTPGAIDTPALDIWRNIPGAFEKLTADQSIPRIGRPEEVAYAALYLASDEAAYTTGANIIVDGGSRQGRGQDYGLSSSDWEKAAEKQNN